MGLLPSARSVTVALTFVQGPYPSRFTRTEPVKVEKKRDSEFGKI